MTLRPLLLTLVFAAGLAGCGKTGDLERPAPLVGSRAKADYAAQKTAAAAAKAAKDAAARENEQNNTVFDPAATPPTNAPYTPTIPGRDNHLSQPSPTAGQSQNNQ